MDKLPASAGSGARWHGFMHTIQKYIKDEGEITMKVTVIGSHLCPDTLYALQQLAAAGAEIDFKDILSCHADLNNSKLLLSDQHWLWWPYFNA